MNRQEFVVRTLRNLADDLDVCCLESDCENEKVIDYLRYRLEAGLWNGIALSGNRLVDEQVKEGKRFGTFYGSAMGGKWWINDRNEVDWKHTTYNY